MTERTTWDHASSSPLRYMRQLRLKRERNDLLTRADRESITDIAARWDFFHIDLFARQYRETRSRTYGVTDALVHDSQKLDGLLNKANTSNDVYADSVYRAAEIEARLATHGFTSRIRVRVEHVFAAQENTPSGRLVRTIGMARAKAKIGLANLVYNIRRMLTLERMAAA